MATVDAIADIRLERLTGTIGAIVHGVGLDERSPAVGETLTQALHEHGVLFFEYPKVVTEDEFTGFSELFGELEGPYRLTMKEQNSVGYMDADNVPLKENRITYFHTDGTPP